MIIRSEFKSAFPIAHGHLETILPYFFRKKPVLNYQRERLELDDGDFLDLDWLKKSNRSSLVIISHGLEGSSESSHIAGQARYLFSHGHDVLAWNCRGCSGEVNRLKRSYHSGVSEDLAVVIEHALKRYDRIFLLGHSMGGNITAKYLAERGDELSSAIKGAVIISAPLCLASSAKTLGSGFSTYYIRHFIDSLVVKVDEKNKLFDDHNFDIDKIKKFRTFKEFDDLITGPLHGFSDAEEYWKHCSTFHRLDKIACKTLILNAQNDPFLADNCYPEENVRNLPHVYLEIPTQGGHIGFVHFSKENYFWNELRTLEFFESC